MSSETGVFHCADFNRDFNNDFNHDFNHEVVEPVTLEIALLVLKKSITISMTNLNTIF